MAKFNVRSTLSPVVSAVQSVRTPNTLTYEGGDGYTRDPQSELFVLATTQLHGEGSFYEKALDRDDRFCRLVRNCFTIDADWTARLLRWLRSEGNIRTAAIVGAAEYTAEFLVHYPDGVASQDTPSPRQVIASVLERADEPGELLAYWVSKYGRKIPKPIKRGIADAITSHDLAPGLYTERSFLKYDTASSGFRFGDVIELTHPIAGSPRQSDLFRHAINVRHGRGEEIPESLKTLQARRNLLAVPVAERRAVLGDPARIADAAMTWESLGPWLQGPMDAAAWESIIPSMGYMALLRNLRNFDEAHISDEVAATICARLADPDQVARSRQFPFRFYSAYRAAPTLRWGRALEKALDLSLTNIPALGGRTLILVDTSGSMHSAFSKDGTLMRWDAAALFGIALGMRCAQADVVSFSDWVIPFKLTRGGSVLRQVEQWHSGGWFQGRGTQTSAALRATYAGHDRVVILTDEQAFYDDRGVSNGVPAAVPLYTWNLAGYRAGHAPSGADNRHTFAGLTDQHFRTIALLETRQSAASWPFC